MCSKKKKKKIIKFQSPESQCGALAERLLAQLHRWEGSLVITARCGTPRLLQILFALCFTCFMGVIACDIPWDCVLLRTCWMMNFPSLVIQNVTLLIARVWKSRVLPRSSQMEQAVLQSPVYHCSPVHKDYLFRNNWNYFIVLKWFRQEESNFWQLVLLLNVHRLFIRPMMGILTLH